MTRVHCFCSALGFWCHLTLVKQLIQTCILSKNTVPLTGRLPGIFFFWWHAIQRRHEFGTRPPTSGFKPLTASVMGIHGTACRALTLFQSSLFTYPSFGTELREVLNSIVYAVYNRHIVSCAVGTLGFAEMKKLSWSGPLMGCAMTPLYHGNDAQDNLAMSFRIDAVWLIGSWPTQHLLFIFTAIYHTQAEVGLFDCTM